MANIANDPAALAHILSQLSANDTAVIRQAEKDLKPFLKSAACIAALLTQLTQNPDEPARHQAALLLKKKISSFYAKFDNKHRVDLKTHMLQVMTTEPSKSVGTALAGAVAVLAKAVMASEKDWPELFSKLMELAQSPNENMRVLNYSLLEQLSESVAEKLKPHTGTLAQMFIIGCQDASSVVSTAAMSSTAAYIGALSDSPEVMQLQGVIAPMLNVMNTCLQNGDEQVVVEGLEVIQECVDMEQPLINDHIEALVPFLVAIIQNESYDTPVKQAAGQTVMTIIEGRPKLVSKKNLVPPLLTALMSIIAHSDSSAAGSLFNFDDDRVEAGDDDDDDEDFDPADMDITRLAQTIIDTMAIQIPSKYFVPAALSLCAQGMQSPDASMRKAGCAVLGVIAEGCCDPIRQGLPEILPRLLIATQDPEYYVRECACFALGQFSEYCQPDILHHHKTVLPAIFQALDDPRDTVQTTSCYVLEMFCENLSPETLRPFLAPLLTKLGGLLSSPKKITQEMALTAIASTAVASEKEFLPYTEPIVNVLNPLLFQTEPAQQGTRGRALECLGHIAVAIGPENFGRYFEVGMRSAVEGLKMDNDDLTEHSYVFFANCAKVMGREFDRFLPELVPYLIDQAGHMEVVPDIASDEDDDEEDGGEHDLEADDDDDDGPGYRVNVHDGFINTKKASITALGSLAEHTKEAFLPYLDQTLETLLLDELGSVHSFHEIIRAEALECLPQLVAVACASEGVPPAPVKLQAIPLPPRTSAVAISSLKACITTIKEDMNKRPVAQALDSLGEIITRLGVSVLSLQGEGGAVLASVLLQVITELFAEKAPSQKSSGGDAHHHEDEEDEDHDNLVMDSVSDLVGVLAKTMGEQIVPLFDQLQKPLNKFLKPSRPYSDRAMAIGVYAEVVAEIGTSALKYAETVLKVVKIGLQDPMESVRRNSAYCLGVLVESTGQALSPHFLEILQALHPLCVRPADRLEIDTGGADVDNALSSVARIIRAGGNAIPLVHVLPVLINALPLRADPSEGPTVYGCLFDLVQAAEPIAVSMLPQIVAVVAETLREESTAVQEVKIRSASFLKFLATNPALQPNLLAAIQQLPEGEIKSLVQQAVA